MSAEHDISGMFALLLFLGFECLNTFKKNNKNIYFKWSFLHFTWHFLNILATGLPSTMFSSYMWSIVFQASAFIAQKTQSALIIMTDNDKISGMHPGLCVTNLYLWLIFIEVVSE